jgi:hypothetical protein
MTEPKAPHAPEPNSPASRVADWVRTSEENMTNCPKCNAAQGSGCRFACGSYATDAGFEQSDRCRAGELERLLSNAEFALAAMEARASALERSLFIWKDALKVHAPGYYKFLIDQQLAKGTP